MTFDKSKPKPHPDHNNSGARSLSAKAGPHAKSPHARSESKSDAKSDAKSEAKSEAKSAAKSQVKSVTKPGAKPEAKAEGKSRVVKPESPPEPRALTHPEIRTIVLGIMLAMFLGALDQTIVATALPTIGRHFGNLDDLSWVVTAYLLTATAVTPLYGKLADIHGRRVVMLTAIGIFIGGLGRLRAGAEHDRAGARPRVAGPRRRRADGAGADHHRRHRLAARARPLSGLYRRGVRGVLGGRPGARRLSDRASRLVADLLDQPAARPRRARHDVERAAPGAVSSAQAHGSMSSARC